MAEVELQLQALIDSLREGLSVEIKNWLNGLGSAADKANLAKEIIALANNGGGFIFIGFEDAEPHLSISPQDNERAAFTQDSVNEIVHAYVSPPCQCDVHFLRRPGGEVLHPVVVVPGGHRTPVFARRGGPGNEVVQPNVVFLRRPGGYSEAARTQDDWEKLLDRLVKARQTEQLDAIRAILNPRPATPPQDDQGRLDSWTTDSLGRWNSHLSGLPGNDARRFPTGYWFTAFRIEPFSAPGLAHLQERLDRAMPKLSGWPPFTFLHVEGRRPIPIGNTIEAWLGANDGDPEHADFWNVSLNGCGFLLRPMQEDREIYGSDTHPGPPKPAFDWVLPIYRMTEVLHFVKALADEYSNPDGDYELRVEYRGTKGRRLWRVDHKYWLDTSGPCHMNQLQSRVRMSVAELEFNLNEHLWRLLNPIYEQFDFTVLPRELVDRVVAEAQGARRR